MSAPEDTSRYLRYRVPSSKVLGPFVVPFGVARMEPIVTFPFVDVAGGNLAVALTQPEIGVGIVPFATAQIVELEIAGQIQGNLDVLKRAQVRSLSGPVSYQFAAWALYDTIQVRARNISGGVPGGAAGAGFEGVIRANVYLQPAVEVARR